MILKQRLKYFERHIQNSINQEVRKEYFRTLAQVIEAENALRHFVNIFYNDSGSEIPDPDEHFPLLALMLLPMVFL